MPELPEVETIKKGLSKRIVGLKIVDIEIKNDKSFLGDVKKVIHYEVISVERRAKLIRIKLSNDYNLLFHLKLTGQLIWRDAALLRSLSYEGPRSNSFSGGHPSYDWSTKLPNSNTRIIFTFDDDSKLFFNDLRKFGWCKIVAAQSIEPQFKEYGLDPFDKKFATNYLLGHAKRIPNRNIKQFLMDQAIAPGMGNIYTDESLFDAKISPLRKVKDISVSEWKTIISSMQKVLNLGLKYGGTTDSDYVNAEGGKGGMQDHLKVYHQTGKPCLGACGGVVKRITIGGRGTHFCKNCQK